MNYQFRVKWEYTASHQSRASASVKYDAYFVGAQGEARGSIQVRALVEKERGGSHYWVKGPLIGVGFRDQTGLANAEDWTSWIPAMKTNPYDHYWVQKLELRFYVGVVGGVLSGESAQVHTRTNWFGYHRRN
jgi:hypothetical protein